MKTTARLFKALSDETRLRILALLKGGELCVCDLMAVLDLPQSTVSRHLAYLRNGGLVEDRRQGVWMFYRLAPETTPLGRDLLALLGERLEEIPLVRKDQDALHNLGSSQSRAGCR
jgi:ArsR family transcriptional regulator